MAGNIEECLKKFIIHVDALGREDEPGGDGFWREFRELRELQQTHKAENKFPAEEGKKDCNIKKNRYKDILPYDHQRVVLKHTGVEGSDYINASFIEDVNGQRSYIASQGPLPHTVSDFWRMLWEYQVEIVFMVCREEEQGRNKCQRYWAEEGESKLFGDIEVTLESEEELFPDFIERKLCARCDNHTHIVKQFHYTGWPDHGVPRHSQEIYKMVGKMREERRQLSIPIVIHCSAGCGRTGTICAVDYAWTMLDQGKIQHGFSMYEIIRNIRQQRQSMVQTPDQYEFVHLVVQSLCEDWLNKFQEHDYANFNFQAQDGEEEVYYNTFAVDSSSKSELAPPVQAVTRLEGPKRPQPTPRPAGLSVEVNNNDSKRAGAPGDHYENVALSSTGKTSVSSTQKPPVSNGNTNLPPKNIAIVTGQAQKKQGHSVAASEEGQKTKLPPSHHPPAPPQNQTNAHKDAVRNRSQASVQPSQSADGMVQKAAQTKNKRVLSSGDVPTNSQAISDESYGIVVKDTKSGKLTSQPLTSVIEVGQKQRETMSAKASRAPSVDSPPVIPDRNYLPEEIDLISKNPPGLVSAMGGIPPPSQAPTQARAPVTIKSTPPQSPKKMDFTQHGVYAEIPAQPIHPIPSNYSANPQMGRGDKLVNTLGRFMGRGKQTQGNVVKARPGENIYRGKNIAYPNRVDRPAGVRQPASTWTTRL